MNFSSYVLFLRVNFFGWVVGCCRRLWWWFWCSSLSYYYKYRSVMKPVNKKSYINISHLSKEIFIQFRTIRQKGNNHQREEVMLSVAGHLVRGVIMMPAMDGRRRTIRIRWIWLWIEKWVWNWIKKMIFNSKGSFFLLAKRRLQSCRYSRNPKKSL